VCVPDLQLYVCLSMNESCLKLAETTEFVP
jgi:hypothetical protein